MATGSGVRFSQKGLQAQTLDIDATIPFATVAEQVGQDVTVYDAGNGKTGVERTGHHPRAATSPSRPPAR